MNKVVAMVGMSVCVPKFICQNLLTKDMMLGGRVFGEVSES